MHLRLSFVVLALVSVLALAGRTPADDEAKPDLKPLLKEVRKLVEKHYPKAKVTLQDQTIHFEFNAQNFMIHEPLLTGEWQDVHEEPGPQKGGIYGDIELRAGQYMDMPAVPQSIDKRYFTLFFTAAYSKKLDHHLYIRLKYPRDVPKEFRKEFERLVDGFEKHVPATGKQAPAARKCSGRVTSLENGRVALGRGNRPAHQASAVQALWAECGAYSGIGRAT